MMMEGKGIEVIDLGTDVSTERFVETIEHKARIICASALLTTTMSEMKRIVEVAEKAESVIRSASWSAARRQ